MVNVASWSRTHIFSVNFSQAYVHTQICLLLKAMKLSFPMEAEENMLNHEMKAIFLDLGKVSLQVSLQKRQSGHHS